MLNGIERHRGITEKSPSAVFNAPTASVFGIALGAISYLLLTYSRLSSTAILIIGLAIASAAAGGMIALVSRWALPHSRSAREDVEIQGQVALVTRLISASAPGEIEYSMNGVRHTLTAQSTHGSEIAPDTEVVIDTVQEGIARVELWSVVERRL